MEINWIQWFESTSWLEWARSIFDLLKGIAWPLAVVFLVSFFRKEIRDRIKDIVSVGPTSVVLRDPQEQPLSKPSSGLDKTASHPLPTVQALIELIEKQLVQVPENERTGKLVYQLAEAQTERNFEFIWGVIFGSQIEALRRLKSAGSISYEEAKNYYETEVRPAHKEAFKDWSYDEWSRFLILQHLVAIKDSGRIAITDQGSDFLVYVDQWKKDFARSL